MKKFFGRKSRNALATVFAVSLLLHVVAVAIFGTIKFVSSVLREETVFEAAPIAPPPQKEPEYTVNLAQRNQSTPPPRPPAIVVNNPSELDIPALDIDVNIDSSSVYGRGGGGFGGGLAGIREMALDGFFFGEAIEGGLGVVLDTTGSMFGTVFQVTKEIDQNFSSAMKVAVRGATFHDDKVDSNGLIPITESDQWQHTLTRKHDGGKAVNEKLRRIYDALRKKEKGFCYEKGSGGSQDNWRRYQSLGKAVELLINHPQGPGTIYVFSDFKDGVDPDYMRKIQNLVRRTDTKVIFWNPEGSWRKDKKHYDDFAKATGGEVKVGGL